MKVVINANKYSKEGGIELKWDTTILEKSSCTGYSS